MPEEVPGALAPELGKPIEPFIAHKVQVIAADGLLFIAAARRSGEWSNEGAGHVRFSGCVDMG